MVLLRTKQANKNKFSKEIIRNLKKKNKNERVVKFIYFNLLSFHFVPENTHTNFLKPKIRKKSQKK